MMKSLVPALLLIAATATLLASPEAPKDQTLYTFDLTYTLKLNRADPTELRRIWDETHFVASLQGVVNRNSPKLYVYLCGGDDAKSDRYWLDYLRTDGKFLSQYSLKTLPDIQSLVKTFRSSIKGLVVYDENVASTSNVASTIAGVNDFACVRFDKSHDSLYYKLAVDPNGPKIPIKAWLINKDGSSMFTGKGIIPGSKTPSTGSSKCDAYIWAKERFLDTGRCNPRELGYYLDAYWLKQPGGYVPNHTLSNHDFFIAKKGFFFDLSPWDDETPVDDINQPMGADFRTLCAILKSAWTKTQGKQMIHAGGFIPWDKKYTNFGSIGGKHDGVPTEWRYAEILSCYNAYMDADALGLSAMANASIYCQYPLKDFYPQKLPTIDDLKAKGYITSDGKVAHKSFITIYVGDYDSAAWLYNMTPDIWNDPARGSIPLGWAFNPNLAERFPPIFALSRETKTENDYFVAGDSGAGYINPGYLVEPRKWSGLPSGLATWVAHCKRWYHQWDISLTGFVIDGFAPPMSEEVMNAYADFSPNGIIGQKVEREGIYKNMPFLRMEADLSNPEEGAKTIISRARKESPEFFAYRTILWSPTSQKKLIDTVKSFPGGDDIEFVDPYSMMLLVKQFYTTGQQKVSLDNDLWDVKSGVVITGHSDIGEPFDIRDMFGGSFGTRSERDMVIFQDGKIEPYTHWVEWKTPTPIELERFELYAHGDNAPGAKREFKQFRLYARMSDNSEWTPIDSFTPTHPYTFEPGFAVGLLHSKRFDQPIIAEYFRAEFDQYDDPSSPGMGPRIVELNGYGKKLDK